MPNGHSELFWLKKLWLLSCWAITYSSVSQCASTLKPYIIDIPHQTLKYNMRKKKQTNIIDSIINSEFLQFAQWQLSCSAEPFFLFI